MSVYATPADLRAYAQDSGVLVPADDQEVDRLLIRSEIDFDNIAGPWIRLSTGRKFDPPSLPVTAREALKRATCAQATFRLAQGEDMLIGADDGIAAVAGLSFTRGPLPRIGPRLLEEAAGHGLLIRSGTVEADAAA